MNWPDFNGIAACLVAVPGIATVVMQTIQFFDARKARKEQAAHKQQLDAISSKVDAIVKADT